MKLLRFSILFFTFQAYAQETSWQNSTLEEFSQIIMDIEGKLVKNESYSFDSEYLFYDDLTTNIPSLKEKAYLVSLNGNEIYLKQFSRYIAQNTEVNVVCDTLAKTIIVSDAVADYFNRKTTSDFSQLINARCAVKKKSAGNETIYLIEFPKGFTYLAAEITIDKSLNVRKYTLYTANEYLDDSGEHEKSIQPRMDIVFKNQKFGNQVNKEGVQTVSDYISLEKGECKTAVKYSDYELIDLRSLKN